MMKKIFTFLLVVLMISSFATVANADSVYSLGDVNMDGQSDPDSTDLVYLRKVLLGTEEDLGLSDVNEDTNVNIVDLVALKKIIGNPSVGITISKGDNEIIDNWN